MLSIDVCRALGCALSLRRADTPSPALLIVASKICYASRHPRISSEKAAAFVMDLDILGRIKLIEVVFVGTLTSSLVHPLETFRRAIVEGAASIIIAHNHPSWEADPSDEDTKITKQMFEAGQVLGISVLDHIVFTKDRYFSFRDNRHGVVNSGHL